MTKRCAGAVAPAVRGRFAAAISVSSAGTLDRGSAAGRRIERGVDVAVLRVGAAAERLGIGQVADDRMRAALGDVAGLFVVADERGHVVSAAHERVENGGADVARRPGQKDPHRGCVS